MEKESTYRFNEELLKNYGSIIFFNRSLLLNEQKVIINLRTAQKKKFSFLNGEDTLNIIELTQK